VTGARAATASEIGLSDSPWICIWPRSPICVTWIPSGSDALARASNHDAAHPAGRRPGLRAWL